MRILGHIHTLNDEEVIDRSLQALLDQTYPLDEILLVDNGSTDRTLERAFPENVTVIRHPKNRGTSGAVVTGFEYALAKGYDWIWLFDGDSAPRRDALEKLVSLYQGLGPEVRKQTWMLASLTVDATTQDQGHGVRFTRTGLVQVTPEAGKDYYEFDGGIWTGCLYKLEAVREIGLPQADYMLDWGEFEYGHRGGKGGFRAFMHTASIVDHNIGGAPSLVRVTYRLGPFSLTMFEFPPIRCYYTVRNVLYFSLYEYSYVSLPLVWRSARLVAYFTLNFLLRPVNHRKQIVACLLGIRDGLGRQLHRRY